MKLELKPEEIVSSMGGLEVAVDGFAGEPNGVKPSQVLIEVHEGMLRVHVWTGEGEDPVSTLIPPVTNPASTR